MRAKLFFDFLDRIFQRERSSLYNFAAGSKKKKKRKKKKKKHKNKTPREREENASTECRHQIV